MARNLISKFVKNPKLNSDLPIIDNKNLNNPVLRDTQGKARDFFSRKQSLDPLCSSNVKQTSKVQSEVKSLANQNQIKREFIKPDVSVVAQSRGLVEKSYNGKSTRLT